MTHPTESSRRTRVDSPGNPMRVDALPRPHLAGPTSWEVDLRGHRYRICLIPPGMPASPHADDLGGGWRAEVRDVGLSAGQVDHLARLGCSYDAATGVETHPIPGGAPYDRRACFPGLVVRDWDAFAEPPSA